MGYILLEAIPIPQMEALPLKSIDIFKCSFPSQFFGSQLNHGDLPPPRGDLRPVHPGAFVRGSSPCGACRGSTGAGPLPDAGRGRTPEPWPGAARPPRQPRPGGAEGTASHQRPGWQNHPPGRQLAVPSRG